MQENEKPYYAKQARGEKCRAHKDNHIFVENSGKKRERSAFFDLCFCHEVAGGNLLFAVVEAYGADLLPNVYGGSQLLFS